MISQRMIDWGSQGCGIREIAAYGEARAAVVGAENVFNFTIGSPSVMLTPDNASQVPVFGFTLKPRSPPAASMSTAEMRAGMKFIMSSALAGIRPTFLYGGSV